MSNNVNFGSTYRIPLTQPGVNKAKKAALKEFSAQFQNHLASGNDNGTVRISVRKKLDSKIERGLKKMGVESYEKYDRHNIPTSKMDDYVREAGNEGNYMTHIIKNFMPGKKKI